MWVGWQWVLVHVVSWPDGVAVLGQWVSVSEKTFTWVSSFCSLSASHGSCRRD